MRGTPSSCAGAAKRCSGRCSRRFVSDYFHINHINHINKRKKNEKEHPLLCGDGFAARRPYHAARRRVSNLCRRAGDDHGETAVLSLSFVRMAVLAGHQASPHRRPRGAVRSLCGTYLPVHAMGRLKGKTPCATITHGSGPPESVAIACRGTGIGDTVHEMPALWQTKQEGCDITYIAPRNRRLLIESLGIRFMPLDTAGA